jgi:murein DD-endopeptidase MepM/ murein hydrolase activator NlpD
VNFKPFLAFVSILLLSFVKFDNDKSVFPVDFFQSPVSFPIHLAGTFGELRSNHFHTGIDIKATSNSIGDPVFAAADGFISKITILGSGYGKSIQIQHANGYSTLYAHMDHFTPQLDSLVRKYQYDLELFEIEITTKPNEYPINKGQQIGVIGMTGNTSGPHLHFEIRKTDKNEACNPLLFGLVTEDNLTPFINGLKIYGFEGDDVITTKTMELSTKSPSLAIKDTITVNYDTISFGVVTYDRSLFSGRNGIYKFWVEKDSTKIFGFEMNKIAFSQSRYINSHLDYFSFINDGRYFNRTYLQSGNELNIYDKGLASSKIVLDTIASKISLNSQDVYGNNCKVEFFIKKGIQKDSTIKSKIFNYKIPFDEESILKNDEAITFIPKSTFYENMKLNYQVMEDSSYGLYSNVHAMLDKNTPIHKPITIKIKPRNIPDSLKSKAYIGFCDDRGKLVSYGGIWDGDYLSTQFDVLGKYCIMIDNIPPTIIPSNFKQDLTKATKFSFEIKDNIKCAAKTGKIRYKATIDGKWILMEYDEKRSAITYKLDGSIPKGMHTLQIIAEDNRSNFSVFNREIKI